MVSKPPVSLVFTTGEDLVQWTIRRLWSTNATHVAIGIGDQLLHAYEPGVILESREAWLKQRQRIVAEFAVLPDVSAGLKAAITQLGKPYDYRAGLKLLWSQLGAAPIQEPSRKAFICSRFAMLIDHEGKIPEWRFLDRERVVPEHLRWAARGGPSFRPIVDHAR